MAKIAPQPTPRAQPPQPPRQSQGGRGQQGGRGRHQDQGQGHGEVSQPRPRREPQAQSGPAAGTGEHLLKLRVKKNAEGGNVDSVVVSGEFDFEAGLGNFNKDEVLAKVAAERVINEATPRKHPNTGQARKHQRVGGWLGHCGGVDDVLLASAVQNMQLHIVRYAAQPVEIALREIRRVAVGSDPVGEPGTSRSEVEAGPALVLDFPQGQLERRRSQRRGHSAGKAAEESPHPRQAWPRYRSSSLHSFPHRCC